MNDQNTQHPATDDPELAKVLAGMDEPAQEEEAAAGGLQFEETPLSQTAAPADTPVNDPAPVAVAPQAEEQSVADYSIPVVNNSTAAPSVAPDSGGELEVIKKDALEQLRPLIDHLNLPAAEKFDILLLIIRSTDDQNLVSQAHETAKAIEDESKRAQALLDIIKEIDYFANQQQ